jgi:hypothetical protein
MECIECWAGLPERAVGVLFPEQRKAIFPGAVLEIGPGPKSILGKLPHHLRQKIAKYAALEPNHIFATRLEKWLCAALRAGSNL